MLTDRAVALGRYARVPRCWDSYEVPWELLPESPRAALLWGLQLESAPFRAAGNPRDRCAIYHALWAAVLSQWAQKVAAELLSEAEAACNGGEARDEGRLWRVPRALLQGMKSIEEVALCDADEQQGRRLKDLLDAIPRVRWSLVDPEWIRRPARTGTVCLCS